MNESGVRILLNESVVYASVLIFLIPLHLTFNVAKPPFAFKRKMVENLGFVGGLINLKRLQLHRMSVAFETLIFTLDKFCGSV